MPDEPACRFTLPIPPSTNNLYLNSVGRVRGPAYRRWRQDAGWTMKTQGLTGEPIAGTVRVLIEAPLNRRRDLDNALKPLLDLMVTMKVIVDDRWIDDLRIVRAGTGDKVTVSIWPMP